MGHFPLSDVNKKINYLTNDSIIAESKEQTLVIDPTEKKETKKKRDVNSVDNKINKGGPNDNFVNVDMEMATPDGMEGNIPMYMKPGDNRVHIGFYD